MKKVLNIAVATPLIKVGNLKYNADEIIKVLDESKADLVLFPELNLTSLYCGDLFLKDEFLPVISNVTTLAYSTNDDAIKLLSAQLTSPVKYKQSIKDCEDKVDLFIEFGNGIVLKGLNKKITAKPTLNVSDMKTLEMVIG